MLVALQAYFNHHATVVQKCWRGYFSRSRIHDFYKRKTFLQSVAAANAAVKAEMEAELHAALSIRQQEAQEAAKQSFETQVWAAGTCAHSVPHSTEHANAPTFAVLVLLGVNVGWKCCRPMGMFMHQCVDRCHASARLVSGWQRTARPASTATTASFTTA